MKLNYFTVQVCAIVDNDTKLRNRLSCGARFEKFFKCYFNTALRRTFSTKDVSETTLTYQFTFHRPR